MEIRLWEHDIPAFHAEAETPNSMSLFLRETDKPLPCVVVLPGGGYHFRAPHEGAPVASFFRENGMQAAVVDYRVAPNRHPAPLADVQRAIRILRAHAAEWMINPEKIIICGFSAGGHLAGSSILLPDAYLPTDETDRFPARPNGAILCYPVISFCAEWGHVGSGKNLLGDRYETEAERFSLEKHVTEQTPPVFLWHTSDDASVNVKNTLYFAERLRECNVPFEAHIFPHGRHGLGMAPDAADIGTWPSLAAAWIKRTF